MIFVIKCTFSEVCQQGEPWGEPWDGSHGVGAVGWGPPGWEPPWPRLQSIFCARGMSFSSAALCAGTLRNNRLDHAGSYSK